MNKPTIELLVWAAVTMSAGSALTTGGRKSSLQQLGYDELGIAELSTRLYRALSGQKKLSFTQFQKKLNLNRKSTVSSISRKLSEILALPGSDSTTSELLPGKSALVCAAIAEKTSDRDFFEIDNSLTLGPDLQLGPAQIEEVKIDIYKGMGSGKSYQDFSSALERVNEHSTVADLQESLPGDDDTPFK